VRCKDLTALRRLRFWALLSVPTVRWRLALQAPFAAPARPVVDIQGEEHTLTRRKIVTGLKRRCYSAPCFAGIAALPVTFSASSFVVKR
jgi:hypothetical protein